MLTNRATPPPSWHDEVRPATPRRFEVIPGGAGLEAIDIAGVPVNFARNGEIYGEGQPAEFIYKLVSGAVRACKLLSDGRRQIGAFYLPGDYFGVEMDDQGSHCLSAEAVVDCRATVIKRGVITSLCARNQDIACKLWNQAARELARAGNHMMLLGRKSAEEKVATFLIEMASRAGTRDRVDLAMSRQDIADYLGLTVETVSRTLAHLEHKGAVTLHSARQIELNDPDLLDILET